MCSFLAIFTDFGNQSFFCRAFSWALLRASSCARAIRCVALKVSGLGESCYEFVENVKLRIWVRSGSKKLWRSVPWGSAGGLSVPFCITKFQRNATLSQQQTEFSEVRNCVSGFSRELAVPPSKLFLFFSAAFCRRDKSLSY